MEDKKYWTPKQAMEYCKSIGFSISYPTVLSWIHRYKLGEKRGGWKYIIFKEKWIRYMQTGKSDAEKKS